MLFAPLRLRMKSQAQRCKPSEDGCRAMAGSGIHATFVHIFQPVDSSTGERLLAKSTILQEKHMPNYWLMKTEPSTYSFDDLEREGKTVWDGVSSNAALKNMRAMKRGDLAFIYHSGAEKAVIGIAAVSREAHPDPKQKDPRLVVVEIASQKRLPKTVPLADIKKQKAFADFALVRIPRLSVMPVTPAQWELIIKMSGGR